MPNNIDLALYVLVVALGLAGVVLFEIVPQYMFATALVYGNF
jgi:hypothetical protein